MKCVYSWGGIPTGAVYGTMYACTPRAPTPISARTLQQNDRERTSACACVYVHVYVCGCGFVYLSLCLIVRALCVPADLLALLDGVEKVLHVARTVERRCGILPSMRERDKQTERDRDDQCVHQRRERERTGYACQYDARIYSQWIARTCSRRARRRGVPLPLRSPRAPAWSSCKPTNTHAHPHACTLCQRLVTRMHTEANRAATAHVYPSVPVLMCVCVCVCLSLYVYARTQSPVVAGS
jgi:hypothetical protein